jgi:hypothetical protein
MNATQQPTGTHERRVGEGERGRGGVLRAVIFSAMVMVMVSAMSIDDALRQ